MARTTERYAKFSGPRLHNPLQRGRLFERLDSARASPIVWITGPPGAGKSTLVASYLLSRKLSSLWYQIDNGDADPAAFYYFLSMAAQQQAGRRRVRPLPLLTSEALRDADGFARRFFRQLFAQLPENGILILDNFQEAETTLAAILPIAAKEIPTVNSVLIVSRTAPATSFSELVAKESLTLLDWDEVKFSLEETQGLCALKGVGDDWLVRAIHQQSEGWAAGATLMIERLKHVQGSAGPIPSDSRESVFNYFARLIYDQITDAERDALIKLAFVTNITLSLAERITGTPAVRPFLERLYRRRMFIDRRAGVEYTYQWHALFRDFLQAQAKESMEPTVLRTLMRQSATLLLESGDSEGAFSLFVRLEDWISAQQVLLASAPELLGEGRRQTVEAWVLALPASAQVTNPWVRYWLGKAVVEMKPLSGRVILQAAHAQFVAAKDTLGRVMSASAILRTCEFGNTMGDYDDLRRWMDEVSIAADAVDEFPRVDDEAHVYEALYIAGTWMTPFEPKLAQWAAHLKSLLPRSLSPGKRVSATEAVMEWALLRGEFEESQNLFRQLQSLFDQPVVSVPVICWCYFVDGVTRMHGGDSEGAFVQFSTIAKIAEEHSFDEFLCLASLLQAQLLARAGKAMEAARRLRAAEKLLRNGPPFLIVNVETHRGLVAQSQGHHKEAAGHAWEAINGCIRCAGAYYSAFFQIYNADMLIQGGELEKATQAIAGAAAFLDRTVLFQNMKAPLMMAKAFLAHAREDLAESLMLLRQGLYYARMRNGSNCLLPLQYVLQCMLSLALRHDVETDYVVDLIRRLKVKPSTHRIESWPWPVRIYALGPFNVTVNDSPLVFSRKTPRKMLYLLKTLVAFGPGEVPEQRILDALWPEEEGDASYSVLGVTVMRLRRLLGDGSIIRYQNGTLCIDQDQCWVDAWEFEARLPHRAANSSPDAGVTSNDERILEEYRGHFLSDDLEQSWAIPTRERIKTRFIQALIAHGQALERGGDFESAARWYLRGIDTDPIIESFYQGLMRCFSALERRTEAVAAFRRLETILSVSLGIRPSVATSKLYRSILAHG